MYKAQSFTCDISSAYGEALTHCWAPVLPGAKYCILAAYSIQTQQCGNQTDLALLYVKQDSTTGGIRRLAFTVNGSLLMQSISLARSPWKDCDFSFGFQDAWTYCT